MKKDRKILLLGLVAMLAAVFCAAQRWRNRASSDGIIYTEGGVPVNEGTVKTAREIASHSTGTPNWTNETGFEKDVFTFVRIIRDWSPYDSPTAGSWITDFPDSDLNLSFRLQQMTSLKVDSDGRVIRLTDPDLFNYPWIYMVEPGSLLLRNEEAPILRKYLLNGGVLMEDDFWGEWQWESFHREIKRVLSEGEFVELPMDHLIFHSVFDLRVPKNKLQTTESPGSVTPARMAVQRTAPRCTSGRFWMRRAGSWSLPFTTATTATAGSAKARTIISFTSFRRNAPIALCLQAWPPWAGSLSWAVDDESNTQLEKHVQNRACVTQERRE